MQSGQIPWEKVASLWRVPISEAFRDNNRLVAQKINQLQAAV
jgi:hypothetical protein